MPYRYHLADIKSVQDPNYVEEVLETIIQDGSKRGWRFVQVSPIFKGSKIHKYKIVFEEAVDD